MAHKRQEERSLSDDLLYFQGKYYVSLTEGSTIVTGRKLHSYGKYVDQCIRVTWGGEAMHSCSHSFNRDFFFFPPRQTAIKKREWKDVYTNFQSKWWESTLPEVYFFS